MPSTAPYSLSHRGPLDVGGGSSPWLVSVNMRSLRRIRLRIVFRFCHCCFTGVHLFSEVQQGHGELDPCQNIRYKLSLDVLL